MGVLGELVAELVEKLGALVGLMEYELVAGIFAEAVERIAAVVFVCYGASGTDRIV